MTNQVAKIIEGNWDQIKGKAKKYWGQLNNDDLATIEGSYDTLVGKLTETYGWTANEAKLQVNSFIDQVGKLKDKITDEEHGIAQEVLETLSNSIDKCHERLSGIEDTVSSYVKNNPTKVLGIAVLTGFAIAKLLNLSK